MAHRVSSVVMQQQIRQSVLAYGSIASHSHRSYNIRQNIQILRPFSTSEARRSSRDASTIDFAYMPQSTLQGTLQSEILRVPILPHNSTAPGRAEEVPDSVIRPEISTVSASGTHIDSPSAMSDVTDNHAVDISPFDLTANVTNAATAAASSVTGLPEERLKEPGMVGELWSGLLDDMLGVRKVAKA